MEHAWRPHAQGLAQHHKKGGPSAHKWLHLSDMQQYRRMDRLKNSEFKSAKGVKTKNTAGKWVAEALIARSKDQRDHNGVFGKVARTIAFRQSENKESVVIGALSPSAATFLAAVQGGKRGGKGAFQYAGRQAVTPAMRRAFWAAGMPLNAKTTVIGQEKRDLVLPVFTKLQPEIERYLVRKITATLARQGIDWMHS